MNSQASRLEAFVHFVGHGWMDMLDPNPFTHLRFVKKRYPDQSRSFDSLALLLGGKLYMNSLLKRECTYQELALAAETNDYDKLDELLVFDPHLYQSKQIDLIQIGHPSVIRHLFVHGLEENRLSKSLGFRSFNIPFDRSSNDYINLSNLRVPLSQSSHHLPSALHEYEPEYTGTIEASNQKLPIRLCVGVVLYKNTDDEVRKLISSLSQNNDHVSCRLKLLIYDNCPGATNLALDESIANEVFSDASNSGFGSGHNFLMSKAFLDGSDVYIGLNPDGFLLPSILPKILTFIASKPPGFLIELNTFPLPHPKWFDPHTGDTEWASGVAFAIDAFGFSKTNGFDPLFSMYCEDVDLSFRFKLYGLGVFVTPFSAFYHDIVPRRYQLDDLRMTKSLIGEWSLCSKWGITDRAEGIRKIIQSIDSSLDLPVIDPVFNDYPESIRELFMHPRYARSLFW